MYDIHSHILPGVDDGAKTMDDSVRMARVAADNGTKTVVATPHRKDVTEGFSVGYVHELVSKFKTQLAAEKVDLKIVLGMENHLDLDLPDALENGTALRLNGSRYVLVELPFFGYPNYVEDVLFKIQLMELTPVLAHPERIEAIQKDLELLAAFVRRGMLSQVTAGSIVGHFGGKVKRLTRAMLKRGLVHVIAADAHFAQGPRSPTLTPGYAAAVEIVDEEQASEMVLATPEAIISNEPLEIEPPTEGGSRWRWWWFGRS